MTDTINSTETLLAEANAVLDIIERGGLSALCEERDDWRKKAAGYAATPNSYAGYASGKAQWEVIIEAGDSKVCVTLRSYEDGTRRATFSIGSQENVGRQAAAAELVNYYCQKDSTEPDLDAAQANADAYNFERWDAERRETLKFAESYPHVEVVHGEYETAVYYGKLFGHVVASWEGSTGSCRISTVKQVADQIADGVRNYIINANADA